MTTDSAVQAWWLAESDRRDREADSWLAAWRAGYAAGEAAHQDDYEQGLCDGAAARKRAQHDVVSAARDELARWGPGGREHFADPRPGDYPGQNTAMDGAA